MNEEIILNVEQGQPYGVGARAYVEQTEDGAVITIIDKDGTTTATVNNGADGVSISSVILNGDYTLTINYSDGTSVTTTSIRGETGASGVYCGTEEPLDPAIDVWVDPSGGDAEDGSVLRVRDGDGEWYSIPSVETFIDDGSLTEAKFSDALKLKTIKDYVTPEMFGAVGDGVADDTVAVASAFQHSNVLLANTYLVSETITSDVKNVFGTGKVKATDSFLVCNNDVTIRDIEIELTNDGASIGITCKGACIVDNIKVTKGLKGIQVDNDGGKCWVTNCTFSDMYGDTARGFENLGAGESYFANNTIANISNNLTRDADGIHFWQGETAKQPYVIIHGNKFHNCRGRAIKASTANVLIENNYITVDNDFGVLTDGFAIDVQKGNSVIRQNYINAPYGILISIRFYDSAHTIQDNFITLSKGERTSIWVNSVDSTYSSNVEIIHNTIYGTDAYSIYLDIIAKGRYTIRNNKVYGRTSNGALYINGTADSTCRFIILDNINVDGHYYFCRFSSVLNVYGDERVRLNNTFTVGNLLTGIRYVANAQSITGVSGDYRLVETKGYSSSYVVFIYAVDLYVFTQTGIQIIPVPAQ